MNIGTLRLLTVKEAAIELGLKETTVRRIFHSKGFPMIRIGKHMYVRYDALVEWVQNVKAVS